ncbi:MAG: restriction endonuclease subunit S, partial [Colwellia sp.]
NGSHNQVKIKGPGVVTGRSGTIGKVHFVDCDYWPLNTSLYVTDFYGNDPKWVYYMLQAFKLERFVEGAGVPTLNRNLFHGELIPLPPVKEQKRIAAILDKADGIRRKRKQAIQLADDFLRSVFLDMFGGPKDSLTVQEMLDQKILLLHKDGNHGSNYPRKEEFTEQGVPFISAKDISESDGEINYSGIAYLEEERAKKLTIGWLKKGD